MALEGVLAEERMVAHGVIQVLCLPTEAIRYNSTRSINAENETIVAAQQECTGYIQRV